MRTFKIPKVFFFDHLNRDCTVAKRVIENDSLEGVVIKETKQYIWVQLNDSELSDFLSDCDYYSSIADFDPCVRGLCLSARATLKALKAQLAA